jgi:hypothetical protein
MISKTDFIENFKSFSDTWPIRIKQSINSNLDGFVSESGFMGEFLASLITGKKGTASAGSGFDLSDGIKADEAKLAVWVRSKKCKNKKCRKSFLFFDEVEKCSCGSTEFEYPSDSRWGIDSKAGIEYKEQLDKYILQVIKPVTDSSDCREFIYEAFLVDANNKYFVEYMYNQYVNSKKSNNCNLLPYSYDFYRAEPVKVISLKISLNEINSNIECLYYNLNNTQSERMPLDIVEKEFLRPLLENNSIPFKKSSKKEVLIRLINEHLDVEKLTIENFPLKKKNHNKNRGTVVRQL